MQHDSKNHGKAAITLCIGMAAAGCVSDASDDTGEALVGPETVLYSAHVRALGGTEGVAGVRWEVLGGEELGSAVSDDEGYYELPIPAGERFILRGSAEGMLPALRMRRSGEGDFYFGETSIASESFQDIFEGLSGIDIDPTKGHLIMRVRDPAANVAYHDKVKEAYLQNISLSWAGDDGVACYRAVYGSPGCQGSLDANPGVAEVINLAPGRVEVTVGPDSLECTADVPGHPGWQQAWPVEGKRNTFEFHIEAGHSTAARVYCE
jgi:hypothetical protein